MKWNSIEWNQKKRINLFFFSLIEGNGIEWNSWLPLHQENKTFIFLYCGWWVMCFHPIQLQINSSSLQSLINSSIIQHSLSSHSLFFGCGLGPASQRRMNEWACVSSSIALLAQPTILSFLQLLKKWKIVAQREQESKESWSEPQRRVSGSKSLICEIVGRLLRP